MLERQVLPVNHRMRIADVVMALACSITLLVGAWWKFSPHSVSPLDSVVRFGNTMSGPR